MSVIAVKVTKNKITIGSDNQTTRGNRKIDIANSKIGKLFQFDDLIVGAAGLASYIQLLPLFLETNRLKDNSEREIIRFFKAFEKWLKIETDQNSDFKHSQFLVVFQQKAFYFYDYYLKEITDYEAIGSGSDWALTAMYLGANMKKAIKAACKFDLYCSGDPKIIEVSL